MEESLERMEMELRMLRKKYYFLQETIESKVDGHVQTFLHNSEEGFVERALAEVVARFNSRVAVVQTECVEIEDDIGKIQLQSAGEVNGEMNAANVKQEPVDYDDNYEDTFDNSYNDDGQDQEDDANAIPEGYEENSLEINSYIGSPFVSEAPESTESNKVDEDQFCDAEKDSDGSDDYDDMAIPLLCQLDYSPESNPVRDRPLSPPILSKEMTSVKNLPREKTSVKNSPREKSSAKKRSTREKISIKKSPREKTSVKNSPREKAVVKSLHKERTPVPAEDAVMKSGYEGVKRKTMNSTRDDKMYKCEECGMTFSIPSFLKRHMLTHLNVRPFKCSLCYKTYKNKSHLYRHVKDSHSGNTVRSYTRKTKKESKEPFVESPIKTESRTKSHPKAEMKVKSAKSDLTLEVAGSGNPYICSICEKKFSYPSHLKAHLLAHARKFAKQGMTVQ